MRRVYEEVGLPLTDKFAAKLHEACQRAADREPKAPHAPETFGIDVAKIEAREESGIAGVDILLDGEILDIDRHTIPARKQDPEHFHYDIRYALRACSDDFVVGDESYDLRWVPLDGVDELSGEISLLRMRDKWQRL